MNSSQMHDALMALVLRGDTEPWERVLEAIRAGEITVSWRPGALELKAFRPPAHLALGQAMRELYRRSGMTQSDVAEGVGVSVSSIARLFSGEVVSNWPTIKAIIECMGGEASDFRTAYDEAKAVRNRSRKQRTDENRNMRLAAQGEDSRIDGD